MSLSDLKKSKDGNNKRRKFTVDEFISDAENYAKGTPEIVSSDLNNQLNLTQAIIAAKQHVADKKNNKDQESKLGTKKTFRHATFTLSEEAIEQLSELAIETKLAKSHILRILIDELCNEDQQIKLHKLLGSKID
ncbi:hypothetical protein WNY51_13515 [Pseudocolwellia sp. AS88]|uniref:hypothetical protein n=1 Tax=Pseudocolwellia sp. AS88 TaxID=3063958 RepID=UPI0026ECB95E|nr:hypothetical protein [Pseudocolwellia sp. AS88]MDO7083927.1 hypothetical protein [Pseudocolwellia sp. AS88]